MLPKYPNLYFLCAGKGDIAPLQHSRWIELGFISNTAELLHQSDLYVLPNRETYFDLIALEVMRSSTPILLAENGGNRYFLSLASQECGGVFYFSVDEVNTLCGLVEEMISIKQSNPLEYSKKGQMNRALYEKYFSMHTYIRNYLITTGSIA